MGPFADQLDRKARRKIHRKTKKILKSHSIERHEFGAHWEHIKARRRNGSLNNDGFEKLCMFLVVTKDCGLPAGSISRKDMRKPLKWLIHSIDRKARKLCAKTREQMANRQVITRHHPPSDHDDGQNQASPPEEPAGEPADNQTVRSGTANNSAWHPPMVAVGENALDGHKAISYKHWLGPGNMRLRNEPSTQENQVLLDFTTGLHFFPLDLLEASVGDRQNWSEAVVTFDQAASVAQVPMSIPEPHRSACIDRVRSCDPRRKPSDQECYKSIIRCIKAKEPVHLADMVAIFCFLHYCVSEMGRNRFLWVKLKIAGLDKCCEFDYEWNIVDGIVYDGQGQSMAQKITTDVPQPRVRRKGRSRTGSKKDDAGEDQEEEVDDL